jgi:hypothetical protein
MEEVSMVFLRIFSDKPIHHVICCLASAFNKQISDEKMTERVTELKGEVTGVFEACKDLVDKMNLVDVLQRLGIDHHFKEQIAATLNYIQGAEFNSSSLHEVSLRFRLLRQHGFCVSTGDLNHLMRYYKNT